MSENSQYFIGVHIDNEVVPITGFMNMGKLMESLIIFRNIFLYVNNDLLNEWRSIPIDETDINTQFMKEGYYSYGSEFNVPCIIRAHRFHYTGIIFHVEKK